MYTLSKSSWNGFMLFGDSHAFWAVVDDLVVTPLVDCHLAPFARKSLDKESVRKIKSQNKSFKMLRKGKIGQPAFQSPK